MNHVVMIEQDSIPNRLMHDCIQYPLTLLLSLSVSFFPQTYINIDTRVLS